MHLSVRDDDATDGVVRAMGDESEPEAFERGLSAPTRERPQIGDTAGASLELDSGQQRACDASTPGSGVNEQHVDQAVGQQVREAHDSVAEFSDEGGRSPASDIPSAQVGAGRAGPGIHLVGSVHRGCCLADGGLEDAKVTLTSSGLRYARISGRGRVVVTTGRAYLLGDRIPGGLPTTT
jgi:hypothetical protein